MDGVQDASRPRAGPSPPDWPFTFPDGSHANLLRPTRADPGHLLGGSSCRLVLSTGPPLNLEQLKHQAKDLFLRRLRRGDPSAIEELREHPTPGRVEPPVMPGSPTELALVQLHRRELAAAGARLPGDRCHLARRSGLAPQDHGRSIRNCSTRWPAGGAIQLGPTDVVRGEPRSARPDHRHAARAGREGS